MLSLAIRSRTRRRRSSYSASENAGCSSSTPTGLRDCSAAVSPLAASESTQPAAIAAAADEPKKARRLIALAAFVGFLVGGWHFAAQNSALVDVYHPAGKIAGVKLWLALLTAFGSGLGIAALIGLVRGARIRLASRRYRKLIAGLQAEVHQLRSLPLSEQVSSGDERLGDGGE